MNEPVEPTKQCGDCGATKPLSAFVLAKKHRDGRGTYCRDCFGIRDRASRAKRAAAAGRHVVPRRVLSDGQAWCPSCQAAKPLTEFGRNAAARNGRTAYCRPCHTAKGKESKERLHGGTRDYHLKRRYGLTSADVDAMVEAQGGVCALCQERAPEHVDHDHLTGQVRGVLCSCCNQGLGNFRDRAQLLRAAVDHLEATTWQRDVRVVPQEAGVYALVPS